MKHLGRSFPEEITLELYLKEWVGSSQLESEEALESRVWKGVHENLKTWRSVVWL